MADAAYSLRDLIAAASSFERVSLSEQTARHYLAEGLLSPARQRAGTPVFGDEHLAQLRMVLRLVGQYVPLPEARRWIPSLTAAQLTALLERPSLPRLPVEGDAQVYLARLLGTAPAALSRAPAQTGPSSLPRPKPRPAESPAGAVPPSHARPLWERIAVDSDIELMVRVRQGGPSAEAIDRMVEMLRRLRAESRVDEGRV